MWASSAVSQEKIVNKSCTNFQHVKRIVSHFSCNNRSQLLRMFVRVLGTVFANTTLFQKEIFHKKTNGSRKHLRTNITVMFFILTDPV